MFWNFLKKKSPKSKYRCAQCGQVHDTLPALAFKDPDHYSYLSDQEKAEIAECSEDFCIIRHPEQIDRFIRTTLTIPIKDACEGLNYGIWVSLSEKSFTEYQAGFKNNVDGQNYFGMICNQIPDYDENTIGIHVNVVTRSGGIRPELECYESGHPLVKDWVQGISIAEAEKRVEKACL